MSHRQDAFNYRKEGQPEKALLSARAGMSENPNDAWNQRALAWVLIDSIKMEIAQQNIDVATTLFGEIQNLTVMKSDKLLKSQLDSIQTSISPGGTIITQANDQIKNSNFLAALQLFRKAIETFKDNPSVNEQYAWSIYKYLSNNLETLSRLEKRKLLGEYLKLQNPRPALVHSSFLKLGIKLSNEGSINLFDFLKVWNPKTFQLEDLQPTYNDLTTYPPLIEQVLKHLIEASQGFDLVWLEKQISPVYGHAKSIIQNYFSKKTYSLLWNAKENNDWAKFDQYFHQYNEIEKFRPSEHHSKILYLGYKLFDQNPKYLLQIMSKCTIESFRKEDFAITVSNEKEINPLFDRIVQKTAKHLMQKDFCPREEVFWILDWLNLALIKSTKNIWLHYYRGRFREKAQDDKGAMEDYKKVLRLKGSEYWAWTAFGDILAKTSIDDAINCYAKALSLNVEENFIAKSRLSFAELLAKSEDYAAAKTELLIYQQYRQNKGKTLPEKFTLLQNADWYRATNPNKNNYSIYKLKGHRATELLYDELEWRKGNFIKKITPENGREFALICFEYDSYHLTATVKTKNQDSLRNMKEGECVSVKVEPEFDNQIRFHDSIYNEKFYVRLLQTRKGELWDSLPVNIGVVDHINHDKDIAHIIFSKDHDFIIRQSGKYPIYLGDFIAARFLRKTKLNKAWYDATEWWKTEDRPPKKVLIDFKGKLEINQGQNFGFVKGLNSIFVPPYLIEENNLTTNMEINGTAIINFNTKNGWGWKCLKIESPVQPKFADK